MEAFVERLVAEYEELTARVAKLNKFMVSAAFKELSETEQNLLDLQLDAMLSYKAVLNSRINLYA